MISELVLRFSIEAARTELNSKIYNDCVALKWQSAGAEAAERLPRFVTKAACEEGTKGSRRGYRGELTCAWVNDRGGKLGQHAERGERTPLMRTTGSEWKEDSGGSQCFEAFTVGQDTPETVTTPRVVKGLGADLWTSISTGRAELGVLISAGFLSNGEE